MRWYRRLCTDSWHSPYGWGKSRTISTVRSVIASNEIPFLQISSIGSDSTWGIAETKNLSFLLNMTALLAKWSSHLALQISHGFSFQLKLFSMWVSSVSVLHLVRTIGYQLLDKWRICTKSLLHKFVEANHIIPSSDPFQNVCLTDMALW